MKYGVLFGFQATLLCGVAFYLGSWALCLLWPALALGWVAAAYLLQRPSLLGKTSSGRIQWPYRVLLFPFHAMVMLTWQMMCLLSREPVSHQIHPTLRVGRRVRRAELEWEFDLMLDLTCEMPASAQLAHAGRYICIPTLDATAVSLSALLDVLTQAIDAKERVYIHCAQGHGRTAFAAALMLGLEHRASTPHQAIELLQTKRPAMGLNTSQMQALGAVWRELLL